MKPGMLVRIISPAVVDAFTGRSTNPRQPIGMLLEMSDELSEDDVWTVLIGDEKWRMLQNELSEIDETTI